MPLFHIKILYNYPDGDGKQLEAELNKKGPGEAFFIFCDVTKEDDIKVCIIERLKF